MSGNINKIGFEEFLEDVFGLNIRSAKTIWTIFKNPAIYFEAANTADWKQNYTPSLRLWLGILTLTVALQFFWANPDGSYIQVLKEGLIVGLKAGIESNGRTANFDAINFDAILLDMMKAHTLIFPFVFITGMSFLALIYRAWGQKLSYVVRQRYIFAIIVPASLISLISTILMTFLNSEIYKFISIMQIFLMSGLYFITAYRGPYAHMESGEKIGRSIFLSLCILFTLLILQFISFWIAMSNTVVPALKAHLGT